MDASGPVNEYMYYNRDKTICISTVIIERILREKRNIIVLAHIEISELRSTNGKGTRPQWARNILDTVLYLRTLAID